MASKQVMCEMCCKEQAVGYCNICEHICKMCLDIHKTGKAFKTHILKFDENNVDTSKSKVFDITEEICKKHPFEKTLFFCNSHDTMICGRCLRWGHHSCGNEVVDLCHEAGHFDFAKVNAMTAALNEIKDESNRLKEELDLKQNTSFTQDVKCRKELDELESKLKRKVEDTIRCLRNEARTFSDKNTASFSCISSIREEKASWAMKEERQLNAFVHNSCTAHLYLMSRNFDKKILEVKRQMKEAVYKHTFKQFCLKENTAVLKCLLEYLSKVGEVQEEVGGSDDGATYSVGNASQATPKTSEGSKQELLHAKPSPDQSKQRSCDFNRSALPRDPQLETNVSVNQSDPQPIYDQLKWSQPNGTLIVSRESNGHIKLEFAFQDGIQMKYNPSPRKPYKGGTCTVHLRGNSESQLVCRMMKEAFKSGLMFTFGKGGMVELDGVTLKSSFLPSSSYKKYIQTLKAELSSKGIREANIDQEKELEETITITSP